MSEIARLGERRRIESLRRLDPTLDPGDDTLGPGDDGLADLLDLFRRLVVADAAALTLVGDARAWTLASAGPGEVDRGGVPRGRTVADRAVRAPDDHVLVTEVTGVPELSDHPWCRAEPGVTAIGAVAVRAPDGPAIGAFELGWSDAAAVPDGWPHLAHRAAAQVERWLERRADAAEYRRFVELAPDAIAVLDLEGTIEIVNPAMGRLVGTEPQRLLGRRFLDFVDPADVGGGTAALARVLAGHATTTSFDLTLVGAGGRRVPVSVSAGQLHGPRRHLQVVVRDLTHRVRTEQERSRLTEQLAQAHRFEVVGKLAGGLAHDLNNLLAILRTNVGMAAETLVDLEGGAPPAAGFAALRADLDDLATVSDRVERLTRKLLQFASRSPGVPQPLDAVATVTAVTELLARSIGPHARLELVTSDDVAALSVDAAALEQAITNLVLNGRDAIGDGPGTVTVTVRRDGRQDEDAVVIEVADDGCGMSPDVLVRAREPLFTTKPPDQGTGLGLATVQAFAEEADGSLAIESGPGVGTRVALILPAATGRPGGTVRDGATVLLAEPAERSRRVIAAMLASAGYRVREVATVDEVADAATDPTVVALISNQQLPTGRAADLIAAARTARRDLGVVLLAASPDGASEGVAGVPVLVTPFASERLLAAVANVRPRP